MNAPLHHKRYAEAVDTFTVFPADDPMDASRCTGRDEARQALDAFWKPGRDVRVHRTTLDDFCRDVTDEFAEAEEPEFAA